jgi:CheY-like chemotaxis protein
MDPALTLNVADLALDDLVRLRSDRLARAYSRAELSALVGWVAGFSASLTSRLPVVAVTGLAPLAPQAAFSGLGGPTARLQKPIEAQHLLQRLGKAMASNSGVT